MSDSQEIARLRREIEAHNKRYYQDARPTISDAEYDALFRRLQELEAKNPEMLIAESPSLRVGGAPSQGFRQVRHAQPMLSLDNLFAKDGLDGLQKFVTSVERLLPGQTLEWIVEPKVDGVAMSVRYEKGALVLAATRGDGETGDDITTNLRTIKSLPQRIEGAPEVLEVRGEVYMPVAEFRQVCDQMRARGEEPFANPRNAAAGSLKLLDAAEVARRPLELVLYGVGELTGDGPQSQEAMLEWLAQLGLRTPAWTRKATNAAELWAAIQELDGVRDGFGFETDGAVVKLNSFAQREEAGFTSRAPRWARAWKYASEQAETRIREITIQVGRTGALTPVAELEPVFLRGSTISRATLHNEDEISRKDIRIGDTVIIEKAGEVIPAVVRVIIEKRPPEAVPFNFSKFLRGKCPVCGGPISRNPEFVVWVCENVACPAQKTRRLEYLAKRTALDLEGLGGTVADALVVRGWVDEPLDVFKLEAATLGNLNLGTDLEPRTFGLKNATKVVDAVQRARTLPLKRWLHGLAIPDVGENTAHDLSRYHASLTALRDSVWLRDIVMLDDLRREADETNPRARHNKDKTPMDRGNLSTRHADIRARMAQLESAWEARGGGGDLRKKVGPVCARSVLKWFASEYGMRTMERLAELGIDPASDAMAANSDSEGALFAGMTFVLTGTLTTMQRSAAGEEIRKRGGNVSGSVSRKTTFLVAGENAGSKLEEAQKLNVRILTEEEFAAMLQGG